MWESISVNLNIMEKNESSRKRTVKYCMYYDIFHFSTLNKFSKLGVYLCNLKRAGGRKSERRQEIVIGL